MYQAYLRMRLVEATHPARYIILNVWDDDSFRNIDAWRTIRFGSKTPCGYTLPHLHVDPTEGTVEERRNICATPESVAQLGDHGWVCKTFAGDPVLAAVANDTEVRAYPRPGVTEGSLDRRDSQKVQTSVGIPPVVGARADLQAQLTSAALQSTIWVLQQAEEFCTAHGKELMVVLSHSSAGVAAALEGKPKWDQELADFVSSRPYRSVDLRDAHVADYALLSSLTIAEYLSRYYIGHYNPSGNFFFANAVRGLLVDWLDPKPLPYLADIDHAAELSAMSKL